MSKPTIREVAARAGVSISVASNALNHKGRVSEETRHRVLEAARALGYVPSYAARRLRGVSRAIGMLVIAAQEELISVRYFSEPLYAMVRAVEKADYKLHYIHIASNELTAEALRRALSDGAVDGLVVMAPDPAHVAIIASALKDVPYILFGAAPPQDDVSYVDSDGRDGAAKAVRHLMHLGHERIAYLMPGGANYNAMDRLRGYQDVVQEAGLPSLVYAPAAWDAPVPIEAMLADEVTAVLAFDDFYAVQIIGELQRRGMHVPGDVAVIGFDDEVFGQWMYPRLTTLRQPLTEMGQVAADYLIRRLEAGDAAVPLCRKVLPMQLIVRESCGAAG